MSRWLPVIIAILAGHIAVQAQVTNTVMTTADAFLCTGSADYENGLDLRDLNFGAAGTLAVAPATSAKGEFQSIVQFDLSNNAALFDAAYGSNHWVISGIALDLASNYGEAGVQPNNPIFNVISGGQFVIEWLADNDWVEGSGTPNLPTMDGVDYDSLPELLAQAHVPLCTNLYTPPGNNVHVIWPLPLVPKLVTNVVDGGQVTFRFYAADDQVNYLFNSYKFGHGNEPRIQVVASPLLTILSGSITNGGFQLVAIGNDNVTYQVQMSTNLTTGWQTIGQTTADSEGSIQYEDPGAGADAARFYRLSQ